jgi:hypothetical protein
MTKAVHVVAIAGNGGSAFATFAEAQRASEALGNCTGAGTGGRMPDRVPMVANGIMVWTSESGSPPPAPYLGNLTSGEDLGPAGDPSEKHRYCASAATVLELPGRQPGETFRISITPAAPKTEPARCVTTMLPCDPVPMAAAASAVGSAGRAPFPPLPAAALRETPVPNFTGLDAPGGWKQILD